MAPRRKPSFPSTIPIGNCRVVVQAKNFTTECNQNTLQINLSRNATIKISLTEDINGSEANDLSRCITEESGDYFFVLVNPKDSDGQAKSLLKEVLDIYVKELPAMNYAANTGKECTFLERSVSHGKYCTLLLKSSSNIGSGRVIGAITYQIIPADTQYAEVPLAAVSSTYQHKGIGSVLYMELRKRLQNVGITTIFCWGDKLSEGFWLKQGFVSIGEVDSKGRARKLPIKADIRKALSLPGGSTLMVSYPNKSSLANPEESLKLSFPAKLPEKFLPPVLLKKHGLGGMAGSHHSPKELDRMCSRNVISQFENSVKERSVFDDDMGWDNLVNTSNSIRVREDAQVNQCSCSALGSKKRLWEASCTSLKSKKVKGYHTTDCPLDSGDFDSGSGQRNHCSCDGSSHTNSGKKSPIDGTARGLLSNSCLEQNPDECRAVNISLEDHGSKEHPSTGKCFRIMMMNIADDAKKSNLTKIIEHLGGTVTSDGHVSTHVVTGKVRTTLNFCTAVCSGAWIITPIWLKESFRKGQFVDEIPFLLKDEDYEVKYRTEVRSTVLRAKANPGALLKGYDICLATNVQPSVSTLSAIVRSAGGNVIRGLGKMGESSKTIFIACEENMEEALSAVKRGMWTFGSDWFMNCVMRQELDLEAPQFVESL